LPLSGTAFTLSYTIRNLGESSHCRMELLRQAQGDLRQGRVFKAAEDMILSCAIIASCDYERVVFRVFTSTLSRANVFVMFTP
jgi:hypothetical protein